MTWERLALLAAGELTEVAAELVDGSGGSWDTAVLVAGLGTLALEQSGPELEAFAGLEPGKHSELDLGEQSGLGPEAHSGSGEQLEILTQWILSCSSSLGISFSSLEVWIHWWWYPH